MSDDIDVLIAKFQEEKAYARQHEAQRAEVTNIIVAITGGILGLVGLQGISWIHIFAAIFIIVLGLFGVLISLKHYEKYTLHARWAKQYDIMMGEKEKTTRFPEELYKDAKADHKKEFGKLKWLVDQPLYYLWAGIHVAVAVVGVLLLVAASAKL